MIIAQATIVIVTDDLTGTHVSVKMAPEYAELKDEPPCHSVARFMAQSAARATGGVIEDGSYAVPKEDPPT